MSYELSAVKEGGISKRGDQAPSRTLVILVHGWRLDNTQWLPLITLAGADPKFEGCDFYLFCYRRGFTSSTGLEQLGSALSSSIDLYAGSYERIVMIGYSLGGLIVRAAFVNALGVAGGGGHPWAERVTRIVLMATPNRGLGGPGTSLYRRFVVFFSRMVGPRLLRDAIRGSDFITQLRLDWVHAFRSPDIPTPEVVQLLGIQDEYVNRDDSNDVTIFQDAKLFTLANAKHADLAKFRNAEDEKYLRLRASCFDALADLVGEEATPSDTPPSCIVFELHGIRDYGGWLAKFGKTVHDIDPRAKVVGPGYGWFSVLDFVIPWRRRRRIAWFCDRYTEECAALATTESDVPFYFVGHSYGTYLLAQCLDRFPRMHFRRACLVGSVVNEQFQWSRIIQRKQLDGLRNDCASHDWPVGICCRVLNQVGVRELGIGGFVGFRVGVPDAVDYLHVAGNHSATLTDEALRRGAAEYLLLHNSVDPKTVAAPQWLQLASRFAIPLVIIALFIIGPVAVIAVDFAAHWIGVAPHWIVAATALAAILTLIYI